MSSVLNTSLTSLNEILRNTKNLIESNDSLSKAFGYGARSLSFVWEHKFEIAGASFGGFVAWYLAKIWYDQRTFQRMGVKTPPGSRFFYGHYKEMLKKSYSEAVKEWTTKYGKVYGVYEGHLPILIVADADMAQEILIKQYSNFSARRQFPFSFKDDDPNISLFLASKGRWRRQRNIINQTFTTNRLKELFEYIELCSNRFIQEIDKETGKSIVALTYLRRYTMDVIFNCAFGVDIDCQRHPENKFYIKGVESFEDGDKFRWNFLLSTYFIEFRQEIMAFSFLITIIFEKFTESKLVNDSISWLIRNIGVLFEKRFALKTKRNDFVNILLETHHDDLDRNLDKKSSKELDNSSLEKKMTLDEIKINMVGFLMGGFETTSSTLSYCFYMMAKHPEELKKLQDEVDSYFKNSENQIDFDSLSKLEYMDLFIKEVLRFFPLANYVIGRRCTNPCTINGINIPENLTIAIDSKTLHFDPEHWGPDAQEFNPSRFSPEIKRHPAVYLPFGLGPKICVGMKFALVEMKQTLAKLLLKYDVVATPETPKELEYNESSTIMMPRKPIIVAINPRKNI